MMRTIEYKVSFESMVSRIPGLFAYLEMDDFDNMILHKATDSLNGCWGKIVQNIMLPNDISLYFNGNVILGGGNIYSYRTIIDYYYEYKDKLDVNDSFVNFVEQGIGKIRVPDEKKGEATPDYIFLSNAKKIYEELVKMSKMCEVYRQMTESAPSEIDKHLCCLCQQYNLLGGDIYKEYVSKLIPIAEEMANKYYAYAIEAQDESKGMTLNFNVDLLSSYQDLGIMTPYAPIWIPGKRYYKNEKVVYDNELYICKEENCGYFDEDLLTIVFDKEKFDKCDNSMNVFNDEGQPSDLSPLGFEITGKTDSKISELRRFVSYYNDDGMVEKPLNGYDWLFYYRKGVAVNIKTINDDLGNVKTLSNETATSKNDMLAAYGDIITNISISEEEERTIIFDYRIGVHLKSEENPTVYVDEDGNKLYKWDKFVWDEDDKIGVKYQEKYTYEADSDLEKLINGDFSISLGIIPTHFTFEDYITGTYDEMLPTFKFEFVTINNAFDYRKTIANQNVNIVSFLNDFKISRNDFDEFENCDLIREDYLIGISYKPTKKIDVNIQRGSTSAFEKHMSFGEVKTLEDMENFKNGSFFKMIVS